MAQKKSNPIEVRNLIIFICDLTKQNQRDGCVLTNPPKPNLAFRFHIHWGIFKSKTSIDNCWNQLSCKLLQWKTPYKCRPRLQRRLVDSSRHTHFVALAQWSQMWKKTYKSMRKDQTISWAHKSISNNGWNWIVHTKVLKKD